MAKTSKTCGTNNEFELVAPVKILVRPGFSSAETDSEEASSLRRRSIPQYEVPSGPHPPSGNSEQRDESGNVFLIGVGNQPKGIQRESSLEIEASGDVKNAAFYLEHCFRLMYLTGMSTYNPKKKANRETTWTDTILYGIQKIVYWFVTSVSFVFAVVHLKQSWIWFSNDRGVPQFVRIGSWAFITVSELYYMFLFAFRHKRINDTMITLHKLGSDSIDELEIKKLKCRDPCKMITTLFIVSMIACFIQPMAGYGIKGWSPKKLILDSSTKLAFMILIWKPEDGANATKLEMIVEEYGTKLTPMTAIMGMTDIAMRYCNNLKMDTALNMGIVVAILTFLRNRYFARKVKNDDFKKYHYDAEELDSPTGLFTEFKQVVKKENKVLNGLVGGLLKIIHAYSVMQGASFFMRCVDNEATLTEFAFLIYHLVKVAVMYYFGKKAEAENEVYEQWIIDWTMHSNDPIFLAKAPVILHEMTKKPMGLGRGKFLVGQGFIFRFLGFVGSIFMLEVDDDDDDD